MASRINAVRETMPVTGDPLRRADAVTVASQLRELGAVIADLTDAVHHRADGHANRLDLMYFASAVRPACAAAASLGVAAHRLLLMEEPRLPLDNPRVRANDSRVVGKLLTTADTCLRETATYLHGGARDSPTSDRAEVARSRSTTPNRTSSATTETGSATPTLPPGQTVRGR